MQRRSPSTALAQALVAAASLTAPATFAQGDWPAEPAEFGAFLAREFARWKSLIETHKITAD